jgi:hypothetical protein
MWDKRIPDKDIVDLLQKYEIEKENKMLEE